MLRYPLSLAIVILLLPGCASLGSGMPKLWSSKPTTDQFGNTKPKQSWFGWGENREEDHTALLSSGPIVPQKLLKQPSPEDAAKQRLDQQLAIGNSHEQANQWDKARKVYEQLSQEYATSPKVWHRLAVVNDRTKRHTEAQRLYREALKLDPHNPEYYNDLGYSFFLHGQLEEARQAMARSVKVCRGLSRRNF